MQLLCTAKGRSFGVFSIVYYIQKNYEKNNDYERVAVPDGYGERTS